MRYTLGQSFTADTNKTGVYARSDVVLKSGPLEPLEPLHTVEPIAKENKNRKSSIHIDVIMEKPKVRVLIWVFEVLSSYMSRNYASLLLTLVFASPLFIFIAIYYFNYYSKLVLIEDVATILHYNKYF